MNANGGTHLGLEQGGQDLSQSGVIADGSEVSHAGHQVGQVLLPGLAGVAKARVSGIVVPKALALAWPAGHAPVLQ